MSGKTIFDLMIESSTGTHISWADLFCETFEPIKVKEGTNGREEIWEMCKRTAKCWDDMAMLFEEEDIYNHNSKFLSLEASLLEQRLRTDEELSDEEDY